MNPNSRLSIIGSLLFIWYSAVLVMAQFSLWLNLDFGLWQLIVSILVFLFSSFKLHQLDGSKKVAISILMIDTLFGASLIYGSLWYSNTFIDVSFDSNWYHLDAIHLIKNGWNPIYHDLRNSETSFSLNYLSHFPKGAWLFGSAIFAATQELEMGKASTIILSLAILFSSVQVFKTALKLNKLNTWLLALLCSLNPIQFLNFGTFYSDGQLAALLCLSIIYAIKYIQTRQGIYLFFTLISFAFLANTKYNGTAYSVVFFGAFLTYLFFLQHENLARLVKMGFAWFFLCFIFFGYNPFITNTVKKGHPMYPLNTGTESVFKAQGNYPANFLNMNRFEKFFHSLYAQPNWVISPKSSEIKALFKPVSYESYSYGNPNLAGFGAIVPELLLLLLPLGLWSIFRLEPKTRHHFIGGIALLLISIFINPECWVMRYVPQFWLLIILLLAASVMNHKSQLIGISLAILLLIGNIHLGHYYIRKCEVHTKELIEQAELVRHSGGEFIFDAGWSKPFQYKLEKLGLDLSKQVKLNPADSLVKPFTGGLGAYFKKRTNK